jgi:hypothetical protein
MDKDGRGGGGGVAKHESFLLRVWWRARSGEGQWVGRLEHLQEHAVQTFQEPEVLLAYLRTVLIPTESTGQSVSGAVLGSVDDLKDTATDDQAGALVTTTAGGQRQALDARHRDDREQIP